METQCLVAKPKSTAPVWAYFGFRSDEDGKIIDETHVVCKICQRGIMSKGGNTSNLMSHLKSNHPLAYSKLENSRKRKRESELSEAVKPLNKQPTIASAMQKGVHYEKNSTRWKSLTDSVSRYIAGNMLPIHTVDSQHFRKMLMIFDPKYTLPGRNYFGETAIPALYNEVRNRVSNDVLSAKYFSATTDLWSSIGMVPYLSFTVHYIDENWTLQSRNLQTLYMPEDHTGENIAGALSDTLSSWNLDADKLVTLTTDNGSNIISAANQLGWT